MYVNVHAIVLSARRAGEKDKRLSLFTREKGRLYALAAGAGKPGAKLAAATEPCVESRFRLWVSADKAHARVTGGGIESAFPDLRRSWSRLGTGLFFCEWTDKLTPLVEPHPEKYDLLLRALTALQAAEEATVKAAFLVQFLERAGYRVGQEALEELYAPCRGLLGRLSSYDFASIAALPGAAETAPALEEKLLKFMSPLLKAPLKTVAHRRSMDNFLARVQ